MYTIADRHTRPSTSIASILIPSISIASISIVSILMASGLKNIQLKTNHLLKRLTSLLLLFCLALASCALPPKFSTLTEPPAGLSHIYLYSSILDVSDQIDQTVNYSLKSTSSLKSTGTLATGQNQQHFVIKNQRLLSQTSHVYSVKPGKFKITNLASAKGSNVEFNIASGETVFVYFRPLVSKKASTVKFGHAIVVNKNTAQNQQQALALLQNTRLYPFADSGAAFQQHPLNTKTALPINNKSDQDRPNSTVNVNNTANTGAPKTAAIAIGQASAAKIVVNPTNLVEPINTEPIDTELADIEPAEMEATDIQSSNTEFATIAATGKSSTAKPLTSKPLTDKSAISKPSTVGLSTGKLSADKQAKQSEYFANIPIEDIYYRNVSCKKPFHLSQGCSFFALANKKLTINNKKMKISATEAGDIIYFEAAETLGNATSQILSLGLATNKKQQTLKNSLVSVSQLLFDNNINIERLYRVKENTRVAGWILTTDANSMQLLLDKYQRDTH